MEKGNFKNAELGRLVRFEFNTANRIVFGNGSFQQLGAIAAEMGSRAIVVTGRSGKRADPLVRQLDAQGIACTRFGVPNEPTVSLLEKGLSKAREHAADLVIGFGGGSAMDAGKAIAALLPNTGDVIDYLEVIGKGRPLKRPPAACIAVPTTAGTGAEVTCNAVLKSTTHDVKVSLRSPLMFPRLALIDPELTLSMPPAVTAGTGVDALAQLLEAWVSKRANPLTDGLCREGIIRAARSLRKTYQQGDDLDARLDMSLAALFSGLALANAGLGAVHGIAGPLGGMCAAPHGAACGLLLPFVMEGNVRALQKRRPQSAAHARYLRAARMLTGSQSADVPNAVQWLQDLCRDLNIPPLSHYDLAPTRIPQLVAQAEKASSMQANPIVLTTDELHEIIEKAFHWRPIEE